MSAMQRLDLWSNSLQEALVQALDRLWVMQLQCGGAILICPAIAAIATPLQTPGGPALLSLLLQRDQPKTCGALFLGKLGLGTWTETVPDRNAHKHEAHWHHPPNPGHVALGNSCLVERSVVAASLHPLFSLSSEGSQRRPGNLRVRQSS